MPLKKRRRPTALSLLRPQKSDVLLFAEGPGGFLRQLLSVYLRLAGTHELEEVVDGRQISVDGGGLHLEPLLEVPLEAPHHMGPLPVIFGEHPHILPGLAQVAQKMVDSRPIGPPGLLCEWLSFEPGEVFLVILAGGFQEGCVHGGGGLFEEIYRSPC
jgi:hypothetical protein